MAAPVAEKSGWTGPDWPSDEGDALLLEEGEDAVRFKAAVLGVCRLQHTSSEDYIAKEVKSTFGTHFRTLLGLRRLVCRLESPKMTPTMLDKHFLMTMDWLKTYARRKDLQIKYDVSKRGCDEWKWLVLSQLTTQLPHPNAAYRHILEPDYCRWHRTLGMEYCCLAVDTQFTQTTSQSSSDRLRYNSGKSKANGVKIETGVIHKGPFERFICHVFGPEPASTHDFALAQAQLLPLLLPKEKLSGDTGYTGSSSNIVPFKRNRHLNDERNAFNKDVSRAHVPVEHCNREISIFAACSQRFRHRLRNGGINTSLQADVFHVCIFMANRNILDSHGQTNAWSIPSRPRRSEKWALKHLSDAFWTQELDDKWGPRGPIRSLP